MVDWMVTEELPTAARSESEPRLWMQFLFELKLLYICNICNWSVVDTISCQFLKLFCGRTWSGLACYSRENKKLNLCQPWSERDCEGIKVADFPHKRFRLTIARNCSSRWLRHNRGSWDFCQPWTRIGFHQNSVMLEFHCIVEIGIDLCGLLLLQCFSCWCVGLDMALKVSFSMTPHPRSLPAGQ